MVPLPCPHGDPSTSHPLPFTEDPPVLSPWGRSQLELHCCPSSHILITEDPIAWILRVGFHLKLHHCPSNPICVTGATFAMSLGGDPPKQHSGHRGPLHLAPMVGSPWQTLPLWWGPPCIALSPQWRPHLKIMQVTEDSFTLSPWWGTHGKPHPRHPMGDPISSPHPHYRTPHGPIPLPLGPRELHGLGLPMGPHLTHLPSPWRPF